ncbi:hypothetical protein [Ilumatobacter sp.]|uniref:hypothetical protein n=1 Tax=Ilumatobacter sp. TaxID=1967498 RepID=UPI003C31E48E
MFLPIVLRGTPRGLDRRIDDDTELVIEGYPRSANTFAAAAIAYASRRELRVASHVHTPSQVLEAVKRTVPTLVVVREPQATVRSIVVAAPHLRVDEALAEWIHHYSLIWPVREHFVIATFDQVIDDFGAVTSRVNDRFGTDFAIFDASPAARAAVEGRIRADHERWHPGDSASLPVPDNDRTDRNRWLSDAIRTRCTGDALERAAEIFADYVDASS